MNAPSLLDELKVLVQREQSSPSHIATGHDFAHVVRVVSLSKKICQHTLGSTGWETLNPDRVELLSFCHDIGDYKFAGSNHLKAGNNCDTTLEELLNSLLSHGLHKNDFAWLVENIPRVSFSYLKRHSEKAGILPLPLEVKVVQDADRLDAMGAVGVARAFAYGGKCGQPLYQKKLTTGTTLAHFEEKLLHLRDGMNTAFGRSLADHRHRILADFVENFLNEWSLSELDYDLN